MTEKTRLDSDEMFSLLAEVVNKVPASKSALPDTELVRSTRAQLEKEVAEITAKGQTVDVPHEWS